jgi:RND family efflux transporter MFP subunit
MRNMRTQRKSIRNFLKYVSRGKIRWEQTEARVATVSLIGLVILLAVGIAPRIWRYRDLTAGVHAVETHVLSVTTMAPVRAAATTDLVLPGSIQAIQETAVYARVDGYLKRRLVDIGDHVQSGQVLAEIDTPELDQQLRQTEATLAQTRSTLEQTRAALQHNQSQLDYNRTTLSRWRTLKDRELVAQQDVDDREVQVKSAQADLDAAQANVAAAEANVTANEANVRRIRELQSFQKVRAPFDGVITVRNVDAGVLIAAGSAANNTPLFRMAQTESLRIIVNVPQTFMTSMAPGLGAELTVREFPQRAFNARVVSVSGALDPTSRTLLTEVQMPNQGGVLRPGMYAEVKFHLTRSDPPLMIPASALIVSFGQPRVATVGPDNRIRSHSVQLGRDYGTRIEIVDGLSEKDRLLVAPPDGLQDGTLVHPINAASSDLGASQQAAEK